jgi:Holliday junction resolvase
MARESILQSKILKWLRSKGYHPEKIIVAAQTGAPDIIACVNGYYVAIEVKSPGKQLTQLQEYKKKLIEESGGVYITAWSLANVEEVIKSLTINDI